MLKANAISINKEKINEDFKFSEKILINNKYIIIQKGKKNYYLIIAS